MLTAEPSLDGPSRPADLATRAVAAWRAPITIDTYLPAPPGRFPAYLDRRVYQGSSGRVYPLPFHDRIEPEKRPVEWDAVHLENRWLRLMILPQLGGRIHAAQDRTNGYDFFYRNPVIKPALVGLAGPWIAGGVELNWPQHHRPATFLPTDVEIEQEDDGAVTVWCSDHDPFTRMKGMHGVRLHPERSTIELRVRLYNRGEQTETFLWWANVAARVHGAYQSFFPRDVRMVADHAKRAITAFPAADRPYYGIDYPARRELVTEVAPGIGVSGDRLDWYRNLPVPTSYMALGSREDYFGGYDHEAGAGFVHVADHQLAVGKKQWTWGAAPFGRAWDDNLADDDAAYVELMAGVYTDNQPDFSFLAPGETKVFSQFWYPIQRIGPADAASVDAAVRVEIVDGTADASDARPDAEPGQARVGVAVTADCPDCRIELHDGAGRLLASARADLSPGAPAQVSLPLPVHREELLRVVVSHGGRRLVTWSSQVPGGTDDAETAQEPPAPPDVPTVEELAVIAAHLEQYRHATRSPEPYWREALRRDPGHVPSAVGLAARAYRRGRLAAAEELLRTAIARLTAFNPNPADTTALYALGLVLERRGRPADAYDAYGRSSWTRAWRAPAGYRMARLDAAAGRNQAALERIADVLRTEPEHLQARTLQVVVLRRLGRHDEAHAQARATARLDPLHWWTRDLLGAPLDADAQTCLDVALEYAAVGEVDHALRVLDRAREREAHRAAGQPATGPLLEYHRAHLLRMVGRHDAAGAAARAARAVDAAYCFPSRLDDALVLEEAARLDPQDARARALLGHWLYAHDRPAEAIATWQASAALDATDPVVLRNLGVALYNHAGDAAGARAAYDAALQVAPDDAQLRFESHQLDVRLGRSPADRLADLRPHRDLVEQRDDFSVELGHLLITAGRLEEAHELLSTRRFQPWEGGEGMALRAWERLCEARCHHATRHGDLAGALRAAETALASPPSLGEARHPLANTARLHLLLGDAASRAGHRDRARVAWREAATQEGDFLGMATQDYSEATYSSILALRRLDRPDDAARLTARLREFRDRLSATPVTVDYFATSLPSLLLFDDDADLARSRRVQVLAAQLDLLDGDPAAARRRLRDILDADPSHLDATDLLAATADLAIDRRRDG